METATARKVHQGHNVKRLRDMMGIKQETLADELNVSQQTMSRIEAKEEIEDETLEKIAKILRVPADAIRNFSEDAAVSIVANNFSENSIAYQYNFNPIEKIVELYERVIKEKEEKNALLERMLASKK